MMEDMDDDVDDVVVGDRVLGKIAKNVAPQKGTQLVAQNPGRDATQVPSHSDW